MAISISPIFRSTSLDPDYTAPLNPDSAPYEGYDTGRQLGFSIQDHIELGDRFFALAWQTFGFGRAMRVTAGYATVGALAAVFTLNRRPA